MDVLIWIVFGLVVGVVAKWIGRALGVYQPGQPAGFIMAVIGAIVVLAVYRLAFSGHTRHA